MSFDYDRLQQDVDKLVEVIYDETRRRYDVFYNPTAEDVLVKGLNANGDIVVRNIPNRSKILNEFNAWKNNFLGITGITSNMLLTVGSGGDYPNLQAALKGVISKYRANEVNSIEIRLKSGYVLENRVVLNSGMNYGFIRITGEDAQTSVSSSGIGDHPVISISNNTIAPIWDQLFTLDSSSNTNQRGFYITGNGVVIITHNSGFTNAGGDALYAGGISNVIADSANFSGSKGNAVYAAKYASVSVQHADLSSAGGSGVYATGNSSVLADWANIDNAGDMGIRIADIATVSAGAASVKNSTNNGVYLYGTSSLYGNSIILDGAGQNGITCTAAASANITNSHIAGVGQHAIYVSNNGSLTCNNSTVVNPNNAGIYAVQSADVSANAVSIDGAGGYGVAAQDGASVYMEGATITNSGSAAVHADSTTIINGKDATIDTAGGNGVSCAGASTGYFQGSSIKNCSGSAFYCMDASRVSCHNATVESCASGVTTAGASMANANGMTASVSGDVIHAGVSSKIIANNVNGTTSGSDSYVYFADNGAYVDARAPQGDNTTNITVNSVTSKQAFILQ